MYYRPTLRELNVAFFADMPGPIYFECQSMP